MEIAGMHLTGQLNYFSIYARAIQIEFENDQLNVCETSRSWVGLTYIWNYIFV